MQVKLPPKGPANTKERRQEYLESVTHMAVEMKKISPNLSVKWSCYKAAMLVWFKAMELKERPDKRAVALQSAMKFYKTKTRYKENKDKKKQKAAQKQRQAQSQAAAKEPCQSLLCMGSL